MRREVTLLVVAALLAGCGGDPADRAVPGPSPTSTSTSAPVPTVAPSPRPSPTPTPAPTPAPEPTRSPPPPPEPSPTPTPTPTPSPTGGRCEVPAGLLGQDVERLPVTRKVVALTFDGGSGSQAATSILDTLAREGVPATFFLTGGFVRSFPAVSARIGREHLVGNHSDTHPDFTTLGTAAVRTEVARAERAIREATGRDPRGYFRFPFGARDPGLVQALNAMCYVPYRWTVDTLGWQGTSGGRSADSVVARVLAAAAPGAIVLMHVGAHPDDGSTLDADALPQVVRSLRRAGFAFVDLSAVR